MNELMLNPKDYGLELSTAETIEANFKPVIAERDGIMAIYKDIITSEINEDICDRAGKLSTALSKVNASFVRVHKSEKEFYLAGGKFVDALKNKNIVVIEEMQTNLKAIKNHFINIEAERIAKLDSERKQQCVDFVENESMILSNLGSLSDELWNNYLIGLKVSHNARIEAAKKAEGERIAAELAEQKERERIRLENEQLKKEAELKAKELALEREKVEAERKESERKSAELKAKQDKIIAEQKAESERILKAEKDKADKLAAELKAKQDAELAEQNRIAKLEAEKLASEKAAKLAPEKDKIAIWIDNFRIDGIDSGDFSMNGQATVNTIKQKFEAFKKWAIEQKETI